jgi:hypothetical protein
MQHVIMTALALTLGIAITAEQTPPAQAQQATIKRTDLATADQSATDAGALWVADIPPGGATGRHTPSNAQIRLCPGGIGDIGDGRQTTADLQVRRRLRRAAGSGAQLS